MAADIQLNAVLDSSQFVKELGKMTGLVQDFSTKSVSAFDKANKALQPLAVFKPDSSGFSSLEKSARGVNTGLDLAASSLPRLRYALYDVSSTAMQAGGALTGFATAVVANATSFETAFTQVQRTGQLQGDAIQSVRDELVGLTRELPLAFKDVAGLASLGAQLGIASDQLDDFTKNIAQFASISNVSTEEAGLAFGRLGALLGVPAEDFNKLGSSVAFAGINAEATEKQILRVAESISGVAANFGLSAEYVVGLSTALASLGVPAEQSRGALTRTFQEVSRAAASGGGILDEYANVLGVTTEQAKTLAETNMQGFFQQLITGLSRVPAEDFVTTLDTLALSDVRVTNTLSRLSGALDLTNQSISEASSAYQEGTFLAESFGAKNDDLASRLIKLQNAVAELADSVGSGLLQPIGAVVEIITKLINGLTEISKNPVGKVIVSIGVALAGLAGILVSAVAAVTVMVAGLIAGRTAFQELAKAGLSSSTSLTGVIGSLFGVDAGAKKASVSMFTLHRNMDTAKLSAAQLTAMQRVNAISTGAMTGANAGFITSLRARLALTQANIAAMSTLQKVQAFAGPIGIALTALSLVAVAWDSIANSSKEAEEVSNDYFSDVSSLSSAFRQDMQSSADAIAEIQFTPEATGNTSGYASDVNDAAQAQENLKNSAEGTTGVIDSQTIAYRENSKAALQNLLATNEEFTKLISKGGVIEQLGGNATDYVNAILGDPINGGKEYVNSLVQTIQQEITAGGGTINIGEMVERGFKYNPASSYQELADSLNISTEEATVLVSQLETLGVTNTDIADSTTEAAAAAHAAGIIYNETGGEIEGMANEARNAAGTFDNFKKSFDEAVGGEGFDIDAMNQFTQSLNTLTDGFEQNGLSFDNMTSGGLQNLANLRQALYDSVSAAEAMGLNAASGVGMVFAQLQASGVETAQILSQLQSMGGVFAQFAGAVQTAQGGAYAGLTSAYNAMQQANKKAGKSADSVAKKVRTLTDYANDLSTVWKRAFDIRFSSGEALDKITKGFRNIEKAAQDAREEIQDINDSIRELNADIQSLSADKALQEYFLSIAEAYGDSLRASEIRAEISKIDAELAKRTTDLAKKNSQLQKAQEKTNKTLVGNSDAAIENRSEILGLVSDYQDYIRALAASGASQNQLRAATAQARADFMAQATQLGYNSSQLEVYAAAFDDVAVAVNNVPRNITVAANTNPALQALNELNSRAASATAPRTMSVGMSVDYSAMAKFARGANLLTQITEAQAQLSEFIKKWGSGWGYVTSQRNKIQSWTNQLNSGNFATGGYTGAGGKYDVAGIVHRGEYVVPKEQVNQATRLPYFMEQPRSFAQGGFVGGSSGGRITTMMVELSPYDRKLLADAGNVQLRLDGKVVAQATNQNNFLNAQRGSN